MRIPYISLVAAGALALGGCAGNFGGLGVGIGYGGGYGGYDGYGPYGAYSPYGGSYGYGYGSPYGYNSRYGGYGYGYDDPWYGGSRYGYGSRYGWYGGSYYPGTGYYVYDRYRRPRTWSDRERRYWMSRQQATTTAKSGTVSAEPNWSRFEQRAEQRRTVRQRRAAEGAVVPNKE